MACIVGFDFLEFLKSIKRCAGRLGGFASSTQYIAMYCFII